MTEIALPETTLPALEPCLNGDLWQQWAQAGRVFALDDMLSAVRYLRLKPNHSCRLTVFASNEGKGEEPPPGYLLHLYPSAERACVAFDKIKGRSRVISEAGYDSFLSEDPPLVAVPFPNDPELPRLRQVYDPDRFRRALHLVLPPELPASEWRIQRRHMRTKLLAYKPGRRAVFRVRVKLRHKDRDEKVRHYWHAKLSDPLRAEERYDVHCRVHGAASQHDTWRVPTPCGFVPELGLTAIEWIKAPMVSDLLKNGDAGHALRASGRAVAQLHGLDLDLPHRPSPPEEVVQLEALARDLEALVPSLARRIATVSERLSVELSRLATETSSIVHGDLHPGQILMHREKPIVLDLDECGRGFAALDLGSFCAGLVERDAPPELVREFLAGYEEAGGAVPDEELLDTATAVGLFRRAMVPFRTVQPDWPRRVEQIIRRVDEMAVENRG